DPTTASSKIIIDKVGQLYDKIINRNLLVRRLSLSINKLVTDQLEELQNLTTQLDLFVDYESLKIQNEKKRAEQQRERRRQEAILKIKKMFGKNAILKGLNFSDGATQRDRNCQIGGHHE
ncbi:MAG: DNA methylase, partial [Muribaculaceae bacterium]|nr:DNA methylase [Muribaculaceae bacterium]